MTDTHESEFNALQATMLVTGQEAVKQVHDGKFYPFGVELSGGDTIKLVTPEPEAGQTDIEPSVVEVLGYFRQRLEDEAFRAFGICFVVSDLPPGASQKTDTLMLHMESRTGVARRVFYPFRKKLLGGTVFDEHYSREVQPLLVGR